MKYLIDPSAPPKIQRMKNCIFDMNVFLGFPKWRLKVGTHFLGENNYFAKSSSVQESGFLTVGLPLQANPKVGRNRAFAEGKALLARLRQIGPSVHGTMRSSRGVESRVRPKSPRSERLDPLAQHTSTFHAAMPSTTQPKSPLAHHSLRDQAAHVRRTKAPFTLAHKT